MLELYQFESCPHCTRVRRKLSELGLDWISRTISADRSERQRVEAISGQPLVPVLADPDHNMVVTEAEDIIAYLDEMYGPHAQSPKEQGQA
jgi:glutaredoxin 3